MITLLSRCEAFSTSSKIAEDPLTSASAPSTAWTASRTRSTVSNASGAVASPSMGAEMNTTPSLTAGVDVAPIPFTRVIAASTSSDLSALATTITGLDSSASPWLVSTFCPTTESNSLV